MDKWNQWECEICVFRGVEVRTLLLYDSLADIVTNQIRIVFGFIVWMPLAHIEQCLNHIDQLDR